jgi:hypothetical protein
MADWTIATGLYPVVVPAIRGGSTQRPMAHHDETGHASHPKAYPIVELPLKSVHLTTISRASVTERTPSMQIPDYLPHLTPGVAREVFADLCGSLPPPHTDSPEARADRDETAMSAVASLRPNDPFEARLASQIIAANAHAMDCLRAAVQPNQQPEDVRRNRAQAATMMRHMHGGLRHLRHEQATRHKADERQSATTQRTDTTIAKPPALPSPAQQQPHRAITPRPATPPADIIAEAERYVAIHPKRAALIRRRHGLPASLYFTAPPPAIVQAIINGTTPNLRALDKPTRQARAA